MDIFKTIFFDGSTVVDMVKMEPNIYGYICIVLIIVGFALYARKFFKDKKAEEEKARGAGQHGGEGTTAKDVISQVTSNTDEESPDRRYGSFSNFGGM